MSLLKDVFTWFDKEKPQVEEVPIIEEPQIIEINPLPLIPQPIVAPPHLVMEKSHITDVPEPQAQSSIADIPKEIIRNVTAINRNDPNRTLTKDPNELEEPQTPPAPAPAHSIPPIPPPPMVGIERPAPAPTVAPSYVSITCSCAYHFNKRR